MKKSSLFSKLKDMPSNQRLSYIWDYYKIHIFSIIILILFISSFIYTQITKKNEFFQITYIGNYISSNTLSAVSNDLNKEILSNDPKNIINLDTIFITNDNIKGNSNVANKLSTEIATGEIDMAIVSKKFFDANFSTGIFSNLDSINGFSSLPLSKYNLLTKTNSKGKTAVYGIYIKNLNIINNLDLKNDNDVLVAIPNSLNSSHTLKMLKIFLK
jgi:hypothetical protein